MSEFVQFISAKPEVVPAIAEKVYDKMWLINFNVMAISPTSPVKATASFVPCRDLSDGTKELKPDGQRYNIEINDLFAEALTNEDVAEVLQKLLTILYAKGVAQGIFAVPE